jgi:site-specific recombinase XerD
VPSRHSRPNFQNTRRNTQKKYKLILAKLISFSQAKGYVMLEQLGPMDVREFRSSWSVSAQTAAKNMSTMKTFFEFCLSNEWISRNPARLVRKQRGRDAADRRAEQKLPFSDKELRKM